MNCHKCHTCGSEIEIVLDGEEWCPHCQKYQRPASHGWSWHYKEFSPCNASQE